MDCSLINASVKHKDVLKNLLQFYSYDFSEYTKADVEESGLFAAYTHLNDYWEHEANRFPYLILQQDKYIGFVLVRKIEEGQGLHFSIAEFFVLKRHRRKGIGKAVAMQVFTLHKGRWEVFQMEANVPAQTFWKNVIAEYTDGKFTEHTENGRRIQRFENCLFTTNC